MRKAEIQRQVNEIVKAPYLKVIHGEPTEGFLGEVPELPGCFTAGETEAEALLNLREAMTAWLTTALDDGDPIPPPSQGPNSGLCLVLALPVDLSKRLRAQAEAAGLTQSQYALRLLTQAVFAGTR